MADTKEEREWFTTFAPPINVGVSVFDRFFFFVNVMMAAMAFLLALSILPVEPHRIAKNDQCIKTFS